MVNLLKALKKARLSVASITTGTMDQASATTLDAGTLNVILNKNGEHSQNLKL